jgi:putative ABC transport system substrate-binding protein
MRRREFITLVSYAAAALPAAAIAQTRDRVPQIGLLQGILATSAKSEAQVRAFKQGLQQLGWTDGRNVKIEYRFGSLNIEELQRHAAELVSLAPDAILVASNPALAALRQHTRTIPIVFVAVADPVGSGFIESLARPGGNITGFTNFEASMGGKWLEALKEVAPHLTRVLAVLHPETAAHAAFRDAAQAAAHALGLIVVPGGVHDAAEIERAIGDFAGEAGGGIVVFPHTITVNHSALIIELAARHRLPAVYPFPHFAADGGLIAYGTDLTIAYKQAASYVDRILHGAKPGDLPVQAPNKFELVINLTTAKALGLTIPPTLLARADEVIE